MTELLQKQQFFVVMVAKLIEEAVQRGYGVTFGEAWRSDEEAKLLEKEGRGITNSNHRLRLAIDLNLFSGGVLCVSVEDYRPLGVWWESQSITGFIEFCWGGNFVDRHGSPAPDADHFSFEHLGVK